MNINNSHQQVSFKSSMTLFVLLLTVLLLNNTAFAKTKVLIINSNGAVPKYQQAQTGFSSHHNFSIDVLDMSKTRVNARRIARIIDRKSPDLIYAIGTKAYMAAYNNKLTMPMVFSSIINWKRLPTNKYIYGVAVEVPLNYQLFIYHYFFPKIHKIGILYNKTYNAELVNKAMTISKTMNIQVIAQPLRRNQSINIVAKKLLKKVDAIWLLADPVVLSSRKNVVSLFKLANRASVPIFSYEPAFKNFGSTLTISADPRTIGSQSATLATLAEKILLKQDVKKHHQDPAGTHIILNLKQVDALRLQFNEESFDSVTEIIE